MSRTYPPIPAPQANPAAMYTTVSATREAVELLTGARGTSPAVTQINGAKGESVTLYAADIPLAAPRVRSVYSKLDDAYSVFDFVPLSDAAVTTIRNAGIGASAAFRAACDSGEDFYIPAGNYNLDETFYLAAPGQRVSGSGARTVLVQQVYGRPVFWITGDEIELSRLLFQSPHAKTALPSWTTGDALVDQDSVISRSAAVYMVGANRCRISRLRFTNHVSGIRIRPLDRYTQQTYDNVIEQCMFKNYDFGVLGGGQVNAIIDNLHGRDTDFTQGSADPHLIYLPGAGSDPSGDDSAPTTPTETLWVGGRIGNCTSDNNPYSSPYKLRNMQGTLVHDNVGRGCARGYDLAYNTDCRVTGFAFTDMPQALDQTDTPISDVNQAGINAAYCTDMQISDGLVKVKADTDVVSGIFLRLNCTRVVVQNTMVDIDFTISAQTRAHYRLVDTVDCVLENIRWRAAGSNKYIIRLFNAENTRIGGTGDQGVTPRVLYMDEDTTGTVAVLDRDTLRFSEDSTTILDLGVGNRVAWRGEQPRFGVFTSSADTPISGYVTILDDAGNPRKLAVIP